MFNRNYLIVGIAAAAVLAVSIPAVMAQSEKYSGFEDMYYPDITGHTEAPDSLSEKIGAAELGLTGAIQVGESKGTVVGAYLYELQGYLVYYVSLVSDDQYFDIIIDAGTGDILHESEKFDLEDIEKLLDEWDEMMTYEHHGYW